MARSRTEEPSPCVGLSARCRSTSAINSHSGGLTIRACGDDLSCAQRQKEANTTARLSVLPHHLGDVGEGPPDLVEDLAIADAAEHGVVLDLLGVGSRRRRPSDSKHPRQADLHPHAVAAATDGPGEQLRSCPRQCSPWGTGDQERHLHLRARVLVVGCAASRSELEGVAADIKILAWCAIGGRTFVHGRCLGPC
jgi:hypothetical protein